MRNVVIDTNAYSALMKGSLSIKSIIENAEEVFIPVIVLGELLFGFKKGSREKSNLVILNKFLELPGVSVLNTTSETAEVFAEVITFLRNSGKPIPTNDIWIAALAVETGSVLISSDKHFLNVPQVRLFDPNED